VRSELESALAQARSLPAEELPRLIGDLAEIQATAQARLLIPSPVPVPSDELLEIEEAAERLSVSQDYLYKHANRLPFTRRMGRRLLFSSTGLTAYLKRAR
jgi:excisionase family DNA binding protein